VYPILIHSIRIDELKKYEETIDAIKIGAGITLTELESILQNEINIKPGK
jgi:xanthine dehydrogenase iron-sulfur cluster and FAD-binding subunit A